MPPPAAAAARASGAPPGTVPAGAVAATPPAPATAMVPTRAAPTTRAAARTAPRAPRFDRLGMTVPLPGCHPPVARHVSLGLYTFWQWRRKCAYVRRRTGTRGGAVRQFFDDFKKYLLRGNVLDLAVAVIIGVAFNVVVQSMVN